MSEPRPPLRLGAVVLAAGSARRFGAVKLIAPLDGRPLLQHVLDALAVAGIAEVVVVLGRSADAVDRAIAWRRESRVVNPEPERGLASSLRVGLEALEGAAGAAIDAAFIVLGDQPRIRAEVLVRLAEEAPRSDRPIVVPAYADGGGSNPVLVRRSAWPRAAALEGDRGLGPIIAGHPELVLSVAVSGRNEDVDTRGDLARLSGGRRDLENAASGSPAETTPPSPGSSRGT